MDRIFTVSELTANLKALVETSFGILWVAGEVSNLRRPGSGHIYFTLKDESSRIRAVMFRQSAVSAAFVLEEGLALVCRGRLNVYAAGGDYQVVVDAVEPRGTGALQVAFEQLKRRLDDEGLFDSRRKRTLPAFPERLGIVTSATGAALHDILTVMERRWPACDVLVAPVRVQGSEAAAEICEALERLNRFGSVDLILVARGGGSLEDLQPFNDERTARAIHASVLPVVSAVGHETDFTIADFVADLRAPTPSAAAELIVPDRRELQTSLRSALSRLETSHRAYRRDRARRVHDLGRRIVNPMVKIADLRITIDDRWTRAIDGVERVLTANRHRVAALARSLKNLSPTGRLREHRRSIQYLLSKSVLAMGYRRGLFRARVDRALAVIESSGPAAVLSRGYSIARRLSDGSSIGDATTLRVGETVAIQVRVGAFTASVIDIMEEDSGG